MASLYAFDVQLGKEVSFDNIYDFIAFKLKQIEALPADRNAQGQLYAKDIWLQSLRAIAEGAENPRAVAEQALKTEELVFPTWIDF